MEDLDRYKSYKNLYEEDHQTLYGDSRSTRDLYGGELAEVALNDEVTVKASVVPKRKYVQWGLIVLITICIITIIIVVAASTSSSHKPATKTPFGHSMLGEFAMEPGYTNLDHASYGSLPNSVFQAVSNWQASIDANPSRWANIDMQTKQSAVLQKMADYLKVNASNLRFVPHAHEATNNIIRAMQPPNSTTNTILYLNFTSTKTKIVLNQLARNTSSCPRTLLQVNVSLPLSSSSIVNATRAVLEANRGRIFLAVFEHITTYPALLIPIQELIPLCREQGILVIVNGNHALGHLPLDLSQLSPDFYVVSGHKWFYGPRGTGLMWTNFDQSGMRAYVPGRNEYSPYAVMDAGLQFREKFGELKITNYLRSLASQGGRIVANAWGTEVLGSNDPALVDISMVNVRIPLSPLPSSSSIWNTNSLAEKILRDNNTYASIFEYENQWWVRLTAQVYNQPSDFTFYANCMLSALREVKQ